MNKIVSNELFCLKRYGCRFILFICIYTVFANKTAAQTYTPVLIAGEADSIYMPSFIDVYNDKLLFSAWDGRANSLYTLDKARKIKKYSFSLKDTFSKPWYYNSHSSVVINDTIYFSQDFFHGSTAERYAFFWCDGMPEPKLVDHFTGLVSPSSFIKYKNTIIFSATNAQRTQYTLYQYQPSSGRVEQLPCGPAYGGVVYNDRLYFSIFMPYTGQELYRYDLVTQKFELVADIFPGTKGSEVLDITLINDKLYFLATGADSLCQLYMYDERDVTKLTIVPREVGSEYVLFHSPRFLPFNGNIYLPVIDHGQSFLWSYNIAAGEESMCLNLSDDATFTGGFCAYNKKIVAGIVKLNSNYDLLIYDPKSGSAIRVAENFNARDFSSYGHIIFDKTLYISGQIAGNGSGLYYFDDKTTEEFRLVIYPNPCADTVHIKYHSSQRANYYFCMYDMSGKEVKRQALGTLTGNFEVAVSISELVSGVYLCALFEEGKGRVNGGKVVKY